MKVKVYRPGEEPRGHLVRDSGRAQLEDLQKLVGGYIEQLHTTRTDMKKNVILVDEDGRSKGLPANYRASSELGYPVVLVGTVVVCGIKDHEWTDYNA